MILFVVYYLPDGIFGFVKHAGRRRHGPIGSGPRRHRRRGPRGPGLGRREAGDRGREWRAARTCRTAVMQFGGLKALERRRPRGQARHDPRPDRPERLGQEHDDERAHRHLRADRGRHRVRGQARIAGRTSPDIALARHRPHVPERAAVRRADRASRTCMVGLHHTYRRLAVSTSRCTPPRCRREEREARVPRGEHARVRRAGRRSPTRRRATCPTASSACSRSAARWRSTRSCCCSTSRPPA